MANQTLTTNPVTFLDYTDERRLDVYIASNLPTTQIYDTNSKTYSPDWSVSSSNLVLNADIYLDAKDVTDDVKTEIKWYEQIGVGSEVEVGYGDTFIIKTNKMSNNALLTYICKAKYNDNGVDSPTAIAKITFTRVDTGKNGADGTSVNIKGTATSVTQVPETDYYTIVYSDSSLTLAEEGDAYVYDGNLYVCVGTQDSDGTDYFINVGRIQGPDGESAKSIILSGDSQIFKVGKNNVYVPETIKVSAQAFNTSVTTWTYSTNGGQNFLSTIPDGVEFKDDYILITGDQLITDSVVIKASDGSVEDVFTVYKAFDGTDGTKGDNGQSASMAFLTNENVTFGANASGQIIATSFTTNVVAYNGTTKVKPNIGTISNLPSGMKFVLGDAVNNEIPIIFTIENNATLGSALSNNGSITIPVNGPVYTNLVLSWSKVNSGAQGNIGPKGSDAYTVLLTNESHVFAGDVANAVDGVATTQVLAYNGTTAQTITIASVNGKTAAITDTDTGISGLKFKCSSLSGTSPTITFTCTNTFVSPSGSIPIVLSVGGVSFTKMFTYSIAFRGVTGGIGPTGKDGATGPQGNDATAYWLVSSASAVQKTSTGTITVTPSTLTFTGKAKTGTKAPVDYACRWTIEYSTDGINYTSLYTSSKDESSTAATVSTGYKSMRARMYVAGSTTSLLDEQIIPVVSDGAKGNDAYTVILTNESHVFAGNVSTAVASSATTQVIAYKGGSSQSVTIVSVNGKTASTSSTATGIAGLSFACSALSGTQLTITFTCTTSFVSPNGTIPIVLTVDGVTVTKMFTYGIAFKGTVGTPASLVDVTPSAHYFKSTTGKDGTFTPDYIYLYPRFQTVTFSSWQYSINGGTTWIAASGANGLTIGEYSSIKNTLRISRTSTLYTDTITSISFRCVSSDSSVYDTVSIAKIYDVIDLEIGGRNLLHRTDDAQKSLTISTNKYGVIGQFVPSTQLWKNGYVDISEYGLSIGDTLTFQAYLIPQNSMSVAVRVWGSDNGTSGSPLKDGNYLLEPGVSSCTFTMTNQYLYLGVAVKDDITNSITEKYSNCKLERGNKATDWSPAPEDIKSTTFQLYAPKGYLLTNDVPSITLETFAYNGSQPITNATFAWYSWNGETWVAVSGATGTSLTINNSNVFKSNVYKCDMTYGGKVYTATATIEDKTDIYDSLIHVTSKYSPTNRLYWVLYSTVYSEEGEKDALLGPISVTSPATPTTGAYWYKIDETNYTVTLMKYSGSAWVTTTDKQAFVYDWFMLNDTNNVVTLGEQSKVKIVTSDKFSRTCSVQCNVLDQERAALTHSNQVLNDPSDPIVSEIEPTNPINGQLWIKTGTNGSYTLLVWDASSSKWVVSEADSQKKVYVSKPTTYNDGDIWIVAAEYEPDSYINGVLQTEVVNGVTKTIKHLAGTMLRAQYASQTYKDSDWVEALNYNKEFDEINKQLSTYNQFFSFDPTGMTMGAKDVNGQISEFSTKLTNTELGFYQGSTKVAYINNNQLNISKAEITNGMVVSGDTPMLQIGNFVLIQESNGSLSIGLKS